MIIASRFIVKGESRPRYFPLTVIISNFTVFGRSSVNIENIPSGHFNIAPHRSIIITEYAALVPASIHPMYYSNFAP